MDTDLASRLLAAARAGDVAQVRALVPCTGIPEEDGPPDAPGGVTPLMAAAAAGTRRWWRCCWPAAPTLPSATRSYAGVWVTA